MWLGLVGCLASNVGLLAVVLLCGTILYVGIIHEQMHIQLTVNVAVYRTGRLPINIASTSEDSRAFVCTGYGLVQCLHCMGR